MLEERSKKGAGRSMRALAWRVCACVRPLYRNLEPITRKPLGGGSGDTSLGVTGVGGCQRAPVRPPGTAPRVHPLRQERERVCLRERRPGEGLEKVPHLKKV